MQIVNWGDNRRLGRLTSTLAMLCAVAMLECGPVHGDDKEQKEGITTEQCKEIVKDHLGKALEGYTDSFNTYMLLSIGDMRRQCNLSDAQVRRLEVAAKGAVERFLDRWLDACTEWTIQRIGQSRRKLDKQTVAQYANPNTLKHYESMVGVHLMRAALSNEKIWNQTVADLLSTEQREACEEAARERAAELKSSCSRYLLAKLDQDLLLSQSQREQLREHIDKAIGDALFGTLYRETPGPVVGDGVVNRP